MNPYIGVKMVHAERADRNEDEPGYKVVYPDGYESWSPKETFEAAYLKVGEDENDVRIDALAARSFIATGKRTVVGDHVVVESTLRSGYTMIDASPWTPGEGVDDVDGGTRHALERTVNEVWTHLGFVLAWALDGLSTPATPESDERKHDA